MPRPLSAIVLASALLVLACEGGKPPASESDPKPTANQPDASKPDASAKQPEASLEAKAPADGERPPPPAWFDAAKIEHQALTKQMQSEGTLAGGYASAMLLELEAGVSNEQCIERAKAALAESLSDLPEAKVEGDRMLLQGKTDDYHYTVVCGEAKGKPTMYLSYTSK